MKPKQIKHRGKLRWLIDARGKEFECLGRFYGPDKAEVQENYNLAKRARLLNIEEVEFTEEDKVAKRELGERGTLLQAVRCFLTQTPAKQPRTVKEAGAEWIAWMESMKISKGYIDRCKIVLGQLKVWVGNDGEDIAISELTSTQLLRFILCFKSVGTKNTVRARLSHLFTFCLRAENQYCTVHPIRDKRVEKIREPRGRKAPPRIFTVEECERLLRTAREKFPQMIPYLALGLFCGIRPDTDSEMGRMTPADIHLKAGVVDVPEGTTKRGDGRPVRLVQTVRERVKLFDGSFSEHVTTFAPARDWLAVAPSLEIVTHRYWRNKLCKAAGVKWSNDVMRHTFATYHYYAFNNPTDTAEQMGHKQSLDTLKKHYLQRVTQDQAKEFWGLLPKPIVSVLEKEA